MNQNIIESEQANVDSALSRLDFSYETVILPSLKRLFDILEKTDIHNLPIKTTISKPVDIYAEALTVYYVRHPYINLPMRIIAFIILYHPFMLNIFQLKHNLESWNQFRIQLVETIKSDYSQHPTAKSLLQILEQEPITDSSKVSAFQLFHYLMGFTFNSGTIAQKPSTLKPFINELLKTNNVEPNKVIIVSINASYNINNKDSIIMYSNVPKSKQRIINESTIEFFNSITQSPVKQQATTAFDILNLSFDYMNNIPDYTHSLVLINYNDTSNYKNNHYTIAYFGKNGLLDKRFTEDFISFKIIRSIDIKFISFYLQESFYESIYSNNLSLDELKRSYIQLMNCVSSTFNKSTNPQQFITQLLEQVKILKLINEHEMKYFELYLSKLTKATTFDLQTTISYVLSYIYPDLLTSSSEL